MAKAKAIEAQQIKVIKRSETSALVISTFVNQQGETVVDLRAFYRRTGEKDWKPTPKGVSLHVNELVGVRNATRKAETLLKAATKPSKAKATKPKSAPASKKVAAKKGEKFAPIATGNKKRKS